MHSLVDYAYIHKMLICMMNNAIDYSWISKKLVSTIHE